jgi:hypothetical protein
MVSSFLRLSMLTAALAAIALSSPGADARILQRCDQAHCYRVWCHNGVCVRRSFEYGRYMNGRDYDYDHSGYYDINGERYHDDPALPVERYMCDADGERCHWARAYAINEGRER